jgi:predicted Zn-dependent protease
MESAVGTYANIIAHELGHYLNLDHWEDKANVMNAVIYEKSSKLLQEQCVTARAAISYYWKAMLR